MLSGDDLFEDEFTEEGDAPEAEEPEVEPTPEPESAPVEAPRGHGGSYRVVNGLRVPA